MIEQAVFKDFIKTEYGRGNAVAGLGMQSNDGFSIGSSFTLYQQDPNAIPSGPSGGSVGPMEHANNLKVPKSSEDETYTTLQILAERWAMSNGFNPDQLTEFGHLMSMVTSTYIPRNKLKALKEIDSGSFGKIFATSYDGAPVAVKQISNKSGECTIKSKMRELLLELRILVRIRHPNIVTFWGTATEFPTNENPVQPYIGLVFELCEKGSLHHALFDGKNAPLKISQKIKIAHQVALGLAYLHGKRIIHRDINTRNILLSNDLSAKIADFGCAVCACFNAFLA
uniref:Protein kinase domain-containing protein n=1 Tax=Guillardia theta TaxID=55529 RepID=A0A6U5VVR8_GUITH|mmetsp:Transcript_11648/g.40220  ORF Transcript_11648/g.40220 Transcript_11648/m.40220 type:complete len:284 (+) Transcript_11648:263-1114(+)